MKKFKVTIFLPILFILAFVNAKIVSIREIDKPLSITPISNTCFNTGFSFPDSEIEHCNIIGHPVFNTYHGFQKIPGYLTDHTKSPVISSLFSSLDNYSAIELFDNNYLSHNYPSHNFW